ncbi:MAG: GAF domain-containing sensor histidine kinase [Nitrospirota bacterium]
MDLTPTEIIAYPLLPIAAMELLLGFLLLGQRRSNPVHRSAAAIAFFSSVYALNTAVMYLSSSRGYDFQFFARLNWIGWLAIPAGLQFLFYLRSETSRAACIIGAVLYPFWAVVLALCLFTDLIVTPGYSLIPYENHPGPLEVPARIIGALMVIWSIVEVVRVRRRLTGVKKFQLDYFFYGIVIYAFGGVTIAGILPAIGGAGVEPGLGSYFGLPWVALTFYAMVRHSLFEMRIIVSRTLTILIVVLAFSGVQAALLTALLPAFGAALASFISLSVLGFFLFGTPVTGKIQALVNSLVIGNRYNYETLMREAVVALNEKKDERELADYLIETACAGPGISDAGIFLHHVEDGFVLRQGRGRFLDMRGRSVLGAAAVKRLQETNRPLVLAALPGSEEDPEIFSLTSYMRGIGAAALVPLLFQGRLQGALAAGGKTSGEAFGQSDIGFLETLAAHAASAFENARLTDITGKIRSSLRESEERFMALARSMPAAVLIHRGEAIVYANAAAEAVTGHSREQLLATPMREIILPDDQGAAPANRFRRSDADPQQRTAGKDVRVRQRNGMERRAVITSSVIEFGERAATMSLLVDLTERERTEGKQRYEMIRAAVGRMAAYISGDLEKMISGLQTAELPVPGADGPRHAELGRKVRSLVQQAEVLDRTLKEFSASPETKRSLQDLNDFVDKRRQILASLLTGRYTLEMRLFSQPLKVMADPIRMERALMNLVAHARDRMPRGGGVMVTTGRAVIDDDFIRRTGYGSAGAYAAVSVSDSGEAMDAAEQERIFEPFFMTRGDWKGSGIGLSMAYDIVKGQGGYITAASRPGQGSTITAYLPLEPS